MVDDTTLSTLSNITLIGNWQLPPAGSTGSIQNIDTGKYLSVNTGELIQKQKQLAETYISKMCQSQIISNAYMINSKQMFQFLFFKLNGSWLTMNCQTKLGLA